jgi:hypothetical protein
MQPLQDLLNRIKWDVEFGKAEFALGYYDRLVHDEKIVPFVSISFDPQRPSTFSFQDEDGVVRHVPFHRVGSVMTPVNASAARSSPSSSGAQVTFDALRVERRFGNALQQLRQRPTLASSLFQPAVSCRLLVLDADDTDGFALEARNSRHLSSQNVTID